MAIVPFRDMLGVGWMRQGSVQRPNKRAPCMSIYKCQPQTIHLPVHGNQEMVVCEELPSFPRPYLPKASREVLSRELGFRKVLDDVLNPITSHHRNTYDPVKIHMNLYSRHI